jgi:hypothetical protein
MRVRRILPALFILLGFACLYLLVKFEQPLKGNVGFVLQKAAIHFENFFYFASDKKQRRRPVSTLKQETELKLYIGPPFRDFVRRDWHEFWRIIYGAYPKDKPEREGLPVRVRQLNEEELKEELIQRYETPFKFFYPEHWKMFFDLIGIKWQQQE